MTDLLEEDSSQFYVVVHEKAVYTMNVHMILSVFPTPTPQERLEDNLNNVEGYKKSDLFRERARQMQTL